MIMPQEKFALRVFGLPNFDPRDTTALQTMFFGPGGGGSGNLRRQGDSKSSSNIVYGICLLINLNIN